MINRDKIGQIVQRLGFLEAKLSTTLAPDELAAMSKEYSDLKPIADEAAAYLTMLDDRKAAEAMLSDPEMAPLAKEEIARLEEALPAMEAKMRRALIPKDAADERPAIVKFARAPAVRKPRFLLLFSGVCMPASARRGAGKPKFWKNPLPSWAG